MFLVCPLVQSILHNWTSLCSPSNPMTSQMDTCTIATARRQVCVVPKMQGLESPDAKPWALPGDKMPPTDHGGHTVVISLGRSFGATPTREGLDPNGRLYHVGVGSVQFGHRKKISLGRLWRCRLQAQERKHENEYWSTAR